MIMIIVIIELIIEMRLRQSQWSHVDLPTHGTNVRLNSKPQFLIFAPASHSY